MANNKHYCYFKPSYDPRTAGMSCAWWSPCLYFPTADLDFSLYLAIAHHVAQFYITLERAVAHLIQKIHYGAAVIFCFGIFFSQNRFNRFSAPLLDAVQHRQSPQSGKAGTRYFAVLALMRAMQWSFEEYINLNACGSCWPFSSTYVDLQSGSQVFVFVSDLWAYIVHYHSFIYGPWC